jgi:GTP-sensing pleiotropic transcriptional regulator CodY
MIKYPANHPIWKIITHSTYGLLITLFLWLNASNFDHTEIKTILEIIAAMVGVEMIKKKLETKDSK